MTGKQGFCWCFGGSRPPEITIEFGHTLKPMTLDIPMPTDENELNEKFEKLVVSWGILINLYCESLCVYFCICIYYVYISVHLCVHANLFHFLVFFKDKFQYFIVINMPYMHWVQLRDNLKICSILYIKILLYTHWMWRKLIIHFLCWCSNNI